MVSSNFICITSRFLLLGLFIALTIPTVCAQEIRYFIGSSAKFSDNIVKNIDPILGREYSINTGISGYKQGSIFNVGGDIKLDYIFREEAIFDDPEELMGDGVLFLDILILPNIVGWDNKVLVNSTLLDPRESANADNLVNQMSYVTGPYWNIKLSSVDRIFLSSNYNYIVREDLDSNECYTMSSSWRHSLKNGYLSLNYIYNDNRSYEVTSGFQSFGRTSGYRTDEIYVDFNKELRSFSFNFAVGEKAIKSDNFESNDLDPTIRSSLNWSPLDSIQVGVKYSLLYEDDIGESNELALADIEDIQSFTSLIDDPFESYTINVIRKIESFIVNYQQILSRNKMFLQYAKSIEDNVSVLSFLDTDQTSFIFTASREINPIMQIAFKQEYLEQLFDQGEITERDSSSFQLNRSLSKNLLIYFEFIYENSSSDFAASEYEELSGFVSLKFTDIF